MSWTLEVALVASETSESSKQQRPQDKPGLRSRGSYILVRSALNVLEVYRVC